ncbi:MAG: hypothetical protein JO290_06945 [Sphingomonadaceae bacterium]|nr:hypothetical protein [Sphingomonadaceae bacterium]
MVEVEGITLMMAIQAVDEVIGRLSAAVADDEAGPDEQVALEDYRRTARELEKAYDLACKTELDLPPYDELINYR